MRNGRGSGEIVQGNQITGYYRFIKEESVDKKSNAYVLRIFDADLKEVAKKELVASKVLFLIESAYNGKSLFFKFYDFADKIFIFYQYDNTAKQKFMTTREASRDEIKALLSTEKSDEIENNTLQAIPSLGFIEYATVKNDELGYAIQFFPEEKTLRRWTYRSSAVSEEVEIANFLTVNQNLIYSIVDKRPKKSSKQNTSHLLAIDAKTGKKIFEKKLEDEQYDYLFNYGTPDETNGDITLFGQFYNKWDKELKDASIGLCAFLIDNKGNIKSKNYVSWSEDVSKFLPISDKGKIDGKGFLFFHQILKTPDGKIFALAEQYKKTFNALGLTARFTGADYTKIVMDDLMLFEFDANFALKDVKIIEKTKTNYTPNIFSNSMVYLGIPAIGKYLKANGLFDYLFIQTKDNNATFIIGYLDILNNKETNFYTIIYADGQITKDMIPLQSAEFSRTVRPAKAGYILITEYNKKSKQYSSRLEKINY